MKLILKLLGVLVLLLIVAVVAGVIMIDSLVRASVEKGGTYALGVPTTLDEADIGLFSGKAAMSGLEVANPAEDQVTNPGGFQEKNFLEIGTIACAVSTESFASETIEVASVELADLVLDLERNSSGTNYGMILDNLERLAPAGEGGAGEPEEEEETSGGKSFRIDRITLRNISVHVRLLSTEGEGQKLTIPEIVLTDVGGEDGASVVELTSQIVTALLQATIEAGGGLGLDEIMEDLSGRLASFEGAGARMVEELEGNVNEKVEKIGGAIEGAAEGLENRLEGLLGGDDDE